MIGTVESYLKKTVAQPFKTVQFKAYETAPISRKKKKKKQKSVLSHIKRLFFLLNISFVALYTKDGIISVLSFYA